MKAHFQYKQEGKDSTKASTTQHESSFTFVIWVTFFLFVFLGVFVGGYKKWESTQQTDRSLQSTHSFDIDPFLIRTKELSGSSLTKINVKIFYEDIRVKKEILNDHNKYKELLMFFMSQYNRLDLSNEFLKKDLEEKMRNNINQFVTSGSVSSIQIQSQFI